MRPNLQRRLRPVKGLDTAAVAVLAVCVLVAVLSGCATLAPSSDEAAVYGVISAVNGAPVADLVARSAVPFVFDAEILMRRTDVEALWTGLRASAFAIRNADVRSVEPLSARSYRLFSKSDEMRIFFERYVPPAALLARVTSGSGTFVFLIEDAGRGPAQLLGFGGPM